MTPSNVMPFRGQIVELEFANGERVRAHILSVDPDVLDNHVFYDVLEILKPGPTPYDMRPPIGFACSAGDIAAIAPTDGVQYAQAPESRLVKKPWWRFW